MDARAEHFTEDVVDRFGHLVTEFGCTGPDTGDEGFVGYHRRPWSIWLVLGVRNKTVECTVRYCDGDEDVHASLGPLVVAAGLSGAQRAATSAQTRKGMAASLSRQAEVLRTLVPVLLSPSGRDLIVKGQA